MRYINLRYLLTYFMSLRLVLFADVPYVTHYTYLSHINKLILNKSDANLSLGYFMAHTVYLLAIVFSRIKLQQVYIDHTSIRYIFRLPSPFTRNSSRFTGLVLCQFSYSSSCQLRHSQLHHCIVNDDVISTGVVWWSLTRTFWPFIVIRSPIACIA